MRSGTVVALAATLVGAAVGMGQTAATKPVAAPGTERVGRYDAAMLSGNTKVIWEGASPELKKAIGSPEKLAALRQQALGDKPVPLSAAYTLTRTVQGAGGQRFDIVYVVDAKGVLAGLLIKPAKEAGGASGEAPTKFLEYKTKAALRLPFEGTWTVAWGGRTVEENYHAAAADQRFAYDLYVTKEGVTHAGDGARNEDYYCYGKPILAPGAGRVVEAVDGVPDNVPGQMNPRQAMGNYVVMDLGGGEYVFLCHIKPGTLKVKKGEEVERGRELGLCGNSGNSSEPHLHMHMQTTPKPFGGAGLPMQFEEYVADGKAVARGEPVRGQEVGPK